MLNITGAKLSGLGGNGSLLVSAQFYAGLEPVAPRPDDRECRGGLIKVAVGPREVFIVKISLKKL